MIHLVNMPFASITHPNLALGLFKAQLTEAGIASRVFNLNLNFAEQIGFGAYENIALFRGVETQISEWLFAHHAWQVDFGLSQEDFLELCGEELGSVGGISNLKAWLKNVRETETGAFLEQAVNILSAQETPKIVAFSCSFFQTIASLALGRLLKARFPAVKLVYGGACFHDEMGEELITKIPWIDAVSIGEADAVIVPLMQALLAECEPVNLSGVLYRHKTDKIQRSAVYVPTSYETLESLPDADFDDFFEDVENLGLADDEQWRQRLHLFFEGSRGCWWGAKQHCTFCGLNGTDMRYRSKSPQRIYQTIEKYVNYYPQCRYQATDNNMDNRWFRDLFPRLKSSEFREDIQLFLEVRVNMSRQRMRQLAESGVAYVQPGIESLSTHLLTLMNKGTTMLQNVYFLKLCREYNILAFWNNLIRIPEERAEDYQEMAELIPKIVHFRPPYGGGARKIECHRFSPYFRFKGRWIDNLRPQPWYHGIFPSHLIDIERVAYYFDGDWKATLDDSVYDEVHEKTLEWNRIWREDAELPELSIHYPSNSATLFIKDTRPIALKTDWHLDKQESLIYQAIADPCELEKIVQFLETQQESVFPQQVQEILDQCIANKIAIVESGKYLGLALPEHLPPLSAQERKGGFRPSASNFS